MTMQYEFGFAAGAETAQLFREIFSHFGCDPLQFLKKMRPEDVDALIDDGALWRVAVRDGGQFVASAYVRVPEDVAEAPEFGGVFVSHAHRSQGLAMDLSQLAIGAYLMEHADGGPILIAHVHVDNESPRKLLTRLGFVRQREITVPDGILGFEAMPRSSEDGLVHGDEFELSADALRPTLERFRVLVEREGLTEQFPLEAIDEELHALD